MLKRHNLNLKRKNHPVGLFFCPDTILRVPPRSRFIQMGRARPRTQTGRKYEKPDCKIPPRHRCGSFIVLFCVCPKFCKKKFGLPRILAGNPVKFQPHYLRCGADADPYPIIPYIAPSIISEPSNSCGSSIGSGRVLRYSKNSIKSTSAEKNTFSVI